MSVDGQRLRATLLATLGAAALQAALGHLLYRSTVVADLLAPSGADAALALALAALALILRIAALVVLPCWLAAAIAMAVLLQPAASLNAPSTVRRIRSSMRR